MEHELAARHELNKAIQLLGHDAVARELRVHPRTLDRWQEGQLRQPGVILYACRGLLNSQLPDTNSQGGAVFTFADLFAGIGGTRIGFERAGGQCVFTSEWDKFCQKTYRANFPVDHPLIGDIRPYSDNPETVPDHDILVAGFPCQPFSISGVSKRNALGRAHGFECETQGTLFFCLEQIIAAKRPTAFLLENVKNLKSHDKGRTFEVIRRTLEDKLEYRIFPRVVDGKVLTPQHRERIYIVGFREDVAFNWDQVNLSDKGLFVGQTMKDVLHPEDGTEPAEPGYTSGANGAVEPGFTLSRALWTYLQDYRKKHEKKGNGFGFSVVGPSDTCRTLSARYFKDGSEILVSRGARSNPRMLTPRECARLMGFPDSFTIPVSKTQAYKQFGNSVVVPVIEAVAKAMAPYVIHLRSRTSGEPQRAMVV